MTIERLEEMMREKDYIKINVPVIYKLHELGITNNGIIMLYSKILSMANKTGYCTASNNYFAETILTCERNIKKHLQKLKEIDAITMFEEREDGYTKVRKIYPKIGPDGSMEMEDGEQTFPNGEQMDTDKGTNGPQVGEHLGKNRGTNGPKLGNKWAPSNRDVKDVLDICTENGNADAQDSRFAPGVANAPGSADATQSNMRERFNYFKSLDYDAVIPSEELPRIVAISYAELDPDIYDSIDSRREKLIKDFTSGYYKAKNKDNIIALIDAVIAGEIQEGK